jgi:GntR family transcriptional regulator/MocR family aminotransferase
VARGTIDAAYALLQSEGYIEPRGQAGTIVAQALFDRPSQALFLGRELSFQP